MGVVTSLHRPTNSVRALKAFRALKSLDLHEIHVRRIYRCFKLQTLLIKLNII